jgi:ribosomal protein S18 acetylase RimI-like enzyme
MKRLLSALIVCMALQMNGMQSEARVCDSDSGDEPAILQIIRENREILIRRSQFDEVAMITKKSLTPENDEKNGSLTFKVLKIKESVLGFTAYDKSVQNKAQVALVAIDEKYRGKGNAKRLLASTVAAIRAEAKDSVDIWAYVRKDNTIARHIWEKVAAAIPDATLHFEEGTGKASDAWIVHLK